MTCPHCGADTDEPPDLEGRTLPQNDGYHAMITPLAKARKWPMEALKTYFLGRIFGWIEFEDFTTGEIHRVPRYPSTRQLGKKRFSQLIEMTVVLAAQDGYELIPPSDWLEEQARKRETHDPETRERLGSRGTTRPAASH